MTAHIHFSQIDIEQEATSKIQSIATDLSQLRAVGEIAINITASTLFYLEALGFVVDFSTGMVTREVALTCQELVTTVTS